MHSKREFKKKSVSDQAMTKNEPLSKGITIQSSSPLYIQKHAQPPNTTSEKVFVAFAPLIFYLVTQLFVCLFAGCTTTD
jgi:hypothetical protein